MKTLEDDQFALRIVQKFPVEKSGENSWRKADKFVIDNLKVREFGLLAKKCRFLVETFATFESRVSFFFLILILMKT